jgi:subtilisin family serine protease
MTRSTWGKAIVAILLAGIFTSCDSGNNPAGIRSDPTPSDTTIAPLLVTADRVPDRYVVVFKDAVTDPATMSRQLVSENGGQLHFSYHSALKGFAATLSPTAVQELRRNPSISYIEEEGMMRPVTDQAGANWGLDRIDQRDRPNSGFYRYTRTGAGVTIYMIDTGIRTTHTEFGGRASVGADFVGDGQNGQDCSGHGTATASVVAGATYGVAKASHLVAVRVFPCDGGAYNSTIIAAVDWVTAHAVHPAVTNMSLSGDFDAGLNAAITNSIASGVPYTIAAGNDGLDACTTSPSSTPLAITAGASDSNDTRPAWSNWGTCVDIFAPGVAVQAAWASSDFGYGTFSGTSLSAPFVAGVAALYLGTSPTATPATVTAVIMRSATLNRLSSLGDHSPNALLYSPLATSPTAFSLNPAALAFTFVRAPVGTAAAVTLGAAAPPIFSGSGGGTLKSETSAEPGTYYATSTGTTLSFTPVLKNVTTGSRDWETASNSTWASVSPVSGALAGLAYTWLTTNVNSSSLALGTFSGSLSVKDVTPSFVTTIPINVTVLEATPLLFGVAKSSIALALNAQKYYQVAVPPLSTALKIAITGATPDADLYVRYNDAPDLTHWDCRPLTTTSNETCTVDFPSAGTYYVMLRASVAFTGVTLRATIGGIPTAPAGLVPTVMTATRIDLKWTDGSSNETSFKLYRSVRNADLTWGAWTALASLAANVKIYSDITTTAATTYQYRIRACNAIGCSEYATSSAATTPP